jgi:hypothetical protein
MPRIKILLYPVSSELSELFEYKFSKNEYDGLLISIEKRPLLDRYYEKYSSTSTPIYL